MQFNSTQKYIFLLLLLVYSSLNSPIPAQNFTTVSDSLINLLAKQEDPTARIDLYNDIAYSFRRHQPDSLLLYATIALEEAEQQQYKKGLMIAHKNIGIYRFKQSFPADSILQAYETAASYAERINDVYQRAALANNIGLVKNTQNKLNEATGYFLEAINILRDNNHPPTRLEGLLNGNLSKCYRDKQVLDKAKSYLEAAFVVANELQDSSLHSIYGDDYGGVLIESGQVEAGLKFLHQAVPLQQRLSDYQSLCQSYMELSRQYLKQGQADEAEYYIQLAQERSEKHGFRTLESGIYLLLGQIKLQLGELDQAINYGQKGIASAAYTDRAYYTSSCYDVLSAAYSAKGDYAEAYKIETKHSELRKQIATTEKAVLADELETQYQVQEQQRQIADMSKEQSTQSRQIRSLVIIFLLAITLLIVLSSALLSNRRKQQIIRQQNEKLRKYIDQNLQLENFVHLASHDLKSPLRNITSFAQLLQRRLSGQSNQEIEDYLQFIVKAGDGLTHMVDDLLQYSIVKKSPNELTMVSIKSLIEEVLSGIKTTIESTGAQVTTELAVDRIMGDETKLKQLFQNLILNAIKFQQSDSSPLIRIVSKDQYDYWLFTIEDNGIGIDPEYQDQIFLMLKRLHSKDEFEGTGIGLAICQSIVEQHGGRIWVSSSPGVGSIFHFLIAKTPSVSPQEVRTLQDSHNQDLVISAANP
ncbi:MAG: ATP-binding protein [Bacteroidota bacterium]